MEAEEFKKLLKNHDWGYRYSDDKTTYANGAHEEIQIRSLARSNSELQAILDEYRSGSNSPL